MSESTHHGMKPGQFAIIMFTDYLGKYKGKYQNHNDDTKLKDSIWILLGLLHGLHVLVLLCR